MQLVTKLDVDLQPKLDCKALFMLGNQPATEVPQKDDENGLPGSVDGGQTQKSQ